MIHFVEGDILLSASSVIAHGVAPHDHFESGLALSLKSEWPAMFKDFRHHSHQFNPESGGMWVWSGAEGKRIACLFTQEAAQGSGGHPGKATLKNVTQSLRALRKFILDEKPKSVALTKLATGVGGLDWKDVEPLLHKELGDLETSLYVYSHFKKGVGATGDTCQKCSDCDCKKDSAST